MYGVAENYKLLFYSINGAHKSSTTPKPFVFKDPNTKRYENITKHTDI